MFLVRCNKCKHVSQIPEEDMGKIISCEACSKPCFKAKPAEKPKLTDLGFRRAVVLAAVTAIITALLGLAIGLAGEMLKNQ